MTMIRDAADAVASAIIAQKDYLTSLDAKIGDGDHGINMARGFTAVQEALDEMDDTSKPGPVLKTIGRTLLSSVGGAAGPLYGTAFLNAAKLCDDDTALNVQTMEKLLGAAVEGVKKRGHAERGEKTILDALIPIHECFLPENAKDKTLLECLSAAAKAARDGVDYTKTIAAKKGRASYVGERSIGYEDPGAVSTMIMFRALQGFLNR